MLPVYIATLGLAFLFGAMAIWGLAWAIRTRQFSDFRRGAASIFDEEEPIGEMTDRFPAGGRPGDGGGSR